MRLPDVLTLTRPLIGLDLETTGTDPRHARIVEIGLEIMAPGREPKEYRTLINPGVPIPPGATAVHGITDDMVADAPSFADIATNLTNGMTGVDYCGYNVRFDLRMMTAEFARARHRWMYDDARVIDAMRLWQVLQPRSLSDAVKHWIPDYEDTSGHAHNALWDVKASSRVIAAQLLRSDLPRDLDALHAKCWPGWWDNDGKVVWKDGAYRLSFGEHKDVALQDIPRGYFSWMMRKDFSDQIKTMCARIVKEGVYPTCPQTSTSSDSPSSTAST